MKDRDDASDVTWLLEQARAAWPDLPDVSEAFVRRAEVTLAGGPRVVGPDLYLACALTAGDADAHRAFERTIIPALEPSLRRIDPSPAFGDEVKQALRDRLFVAVDGAEPRIAAYTARGPLKAWVRVAAVRLALDIRARARRELPASDDSELGQAVELDPEIALLKTTYAAEVNRALAGAITTLTARERAVLKLNVVDGLNIAEIGGVYGVHRATIARWIARARERLFDRTRADLRDRLQLSPSELDSVVRLVRSQIDLRMSQIFSATNP